MDLTGWLLRRMPVRPLIVATPGGTAARIAVERVVRGWGWRAAASPAEANLLVVTGPAGTSVAPFVDAVWRSVPVPRMGVQVVDAARAVETLATAVAGLRDPDVQRSAATQPTDPPETDHGPHHHAHAHQDAHGHHGHDMSGMDMPGGIPMADRAPDRDGLMLDRLSLPLGPVLADWPPGLVVHTRLQGDVIQDATAEVLGSGGDIGPGFWREDGPDPVRMCARRLDSAARLLAVTGWESAAMRARVLRDEVLLGRSDQRAAVNRWAKRIRRSRTLRWSLRGLGVLSGSRWDGTWYAGDAYDRLVRWLDLAGADGAGPMAEDPALTQAVVDALPGLLVGSELAGARLVVASLDPDTELVVGGVTAHG